MILFRKELFFLKLDVKNTCERHRGYLIFTFTQVFFHLWLYEYDYKINWILQGNLYDPFEEFFVKSVENPNNQLNNGESAVVFNAEDEADLVDKQLASKFQLKMDMIPCHVSVSTAEKIFFIGESIQLFERDRNIGMK